MRTLTLDTSTPALAMVMTAITTLSACAAAELPEPDEPTAISTIDPTTLEPFSFFVTSLAALQDLSNNDAGFGGDLRFGESGPGAGLRGADLICATIAERSMTDASAKEWHAFLAASDDGDGNVVDAVDRVGDGPWFDRLGRLVAQDVDALQNTRPSGADAAIENDLPNEDGVPNHQPDPTQAQVDNHHMLTGADEDGAYIGDENATCGDWTLSSGGGPRVGLAWPRGGGGGGGGGGGTSSSHWISALNESGCGPGKNLIDNGPGTRDGTVGSGGGYGGFYCFARHP